MLKGTRMPKRAQGFIFFPSGSGWESQKEISTLRDGRQATNPDFLIRTPEFESHLKDVRETVEDFVAVEEAEPGSAGG